ncbi:MAG: bifunctional precorrin-2 dehydrogenase/sirohydrochlorin ferrochelatase [Phycisphaerae bacterium]|nr:bifunctional precorrin-2 dehydrogenase/sirohydrochlorin ferrochelatase [Phycisphaerae bacterium]
MSVLPIQLEVAGRLIVVIGGGRVAAHKVDILCQAGARVRVVSPEFDPGLLARTDIERLACRYSTELLGDACLIFVCTDDRQLNARILADARNRRILCNVVDDPGLCDFFMPAIVRRGRFCIAVGTGGASPLLAARVRDRLASQFGPDLGILVDELARARLIVQDRVVDPQVRRQVLEALSTDESLERLARDGRQAWRDWFDGMLDHHPRR